MNQIQQMVELENKVNELCTLIGNITKMENDIKFLQKDVETLDNLIGNPDELETRIVNIEKEIEFLKNNITPSTSYATKKSIRK